MGGGKVRFYLTRPNQCTGPRLSMPVTGAVICDTPLLPSAAERSNKFRDHQKWLRNLFYFSIID
jgi:hypothetical protein